jgi:pimeloyl-ACP methyl ester carboxylesterase
MPPSEHDVSLADGRTLRVLEEGAPRGRAIFFLHGSPGSRLLYDAQAKAAQRQGIRLIGYDRPGYGGSTPQPGRRMVDEATHVAAIADSLGVDRFAVGGHSGGGPPTLACAATLPKRVVAAVSLASPAPYPAEGLDYFAGMGELNVTDWKLMASDQPAWEAKTTEDMSMMLNATKEQVQAYMSSLLSPVDLEALTDQVSDFLFRQVREGLRAGSAGARDDSLALAKPWGFDLSSIRVPVQLWHGKQDQFVPFAHGEWLAARVPRVDAHLEREEGHLSLIQKFPTVLEWMAARF